MNNEEKLSHTSQDSQVLLNQIVLDYMKERKWKRRWRWFLRSLMAFLLLVIFYQMVTLSDDDSGHHKKPHIGLIDLEGEIFDGKAANAEDFAKGMESAYKNTGLNALIIRINSPGGSPVQAEYMYNSIKYYRSKYPTVKVYAVCTDLCASAAYYVAAAADEIYASQSSMVGSIGVLYSGFGFVDLMNKMGVTRRLQTSGVNKGFLDPFSPINDEQKQKLQIMLDLIHQQFIQRVKEGRGNRLQIEADTFSGLFWTGQQAFTMGLIDGFGSSGQLARDVIKLDKVIDYTHKQNLFDRVTKNLGTAMAEQLSLSLGIRPVVK